MKKTRWISMLLTATMATVMLTACGDSSSTDTQTTAAASETAATGGETAGGEAQASEAGSDEQTGYAYSDDATGFSVRRWVGTYAELDADEDAALFVDTGTTTIDSVYMGMVYVRCIDLPEDFDETAADASEKMQDYYSLLVLSPVLFSEDADLTEEDLKARIAESDNEVFSNGYTLTAFKTKNGHNIYQLDGIGIEAEYSEYASDKTRETFDKLQSEWEAQRAELEIKSYQGSAGITFSAVDYDGNAVDESIFRNAKLTMINIWGSDCSPCIREMPDLRKLNDSIDDFQVVTILADAAYSDDEELIDLAHEIMETQGAETLTVVLGSSELEAIFPYTGTPTSYLVDSNGNIMGRPQAGAYNEGNYEHLDSGLRRP